ncbi:MAG: carboxypeptidase regulatory-like domain-containing protein [Planctomycetes bacterium]|nr:carboxypeptidase regulatory-like domain-containing protein [Planctomycetota bacterium]
MRGWVVFGVLAVCALVVWSLWPAEDMPRRADPTPEPAVTDTPDAAEVVTAETAGANAVEDSADALARHEVLEREAVRPAIVRGRVVTTHGDPIAGCTVVLGAHSRNRDETRTYEWKNGAISWEPPAEVTTEPDGAFAFSFVPPPTYSIHVRVRCDGYANGTVTWPGLAPASVTDLGDVVLPSGAIVTGRVIDTDGRPVPETSVSFRAENVPRPASGEFSTASSVSTRTDDAGAFATGSGLTPGAWSATVRGRRLAAPTRFVIEPEQRTCSVEIHVSPSEDLSGLPDAITGVVVDEAGDPIAGAELSLNPKSSALPASVRSLDDGSFRIPRPREVTSKWATIYAELEGYSQGPQFSPHAWGATDVRIVLRRTASLSVRVTDEATGQPIEDYALRVMPAPGGGHTVTSSSDYDLRCGGSHPNGVCKVTDLVQHWYLVWIETRDPGWHQSGPLEVDMAECVRVDIPMRRATQRILRVVDASGEPIAGVHAELLVPRTGMRVDLATWANTMNGNTTTLPNQAMLVWRDVTDAHGEARVEAHGGMLASLRLFGAGQSPLVVHDVRLDTVADPWVVTVGGGATVFGSIGPPALLDQLFSTEGSPGIQRAPGLRLVDGSGALFLTFPLGLGKVPLERDGTFRITQIPDGSWWLHLCYVPLGAATTAERIHAIRDLGEIHSGQTLEVQAMLDELVLAPVRGRVLVDDQPHVGIVALERDDAGRPSREYVACDANGMFRTCLRSATWRAVLRHEGTEWSTDDSIAVVPGGDYEATFRFHTGTAHVRVVDEAGAAVEGAALRLRRTDGKSAATAVLTDADGQASIRINGGEFEVLLVPKSLASPEGQRRFEAEHPESGAWGRAMIPLGSVTVERRSETSLEFTAPVDAGY